METIMKYQEIKADKIHKDSHLFNDLSFNSFEMLELICDFEDSLESEKTVEHIKQFRTVGEVVEYLEKVV